MCNLHKAESNGELFYTEIVKIESDAMTSQSSLLLVQEHFN